MTLAELNLHLTKPVEHYLAVSAARSEFDNVGARDQGVASVRCRACSTCGAVRCDVVILYEGSDNIAVGLR